MDLNVFLQYGMICAPLNRILSKSHYRLICELKHAAYSDKMYLLNLYWLKQLFVIN